jgi:5-dehydro-4-deoxyglucarate dehydratase
MTPDEIRTALTSGLLFFPITDFDAAGDLALRAYQSRIEWLISYRPTALFAAAGAGEFFSLTHDEFRQVIRAAVGAAGGRVPVFAAAGYGTRTAIAMIETAAELGADGVLLLPPYLTEATQDGLHDHVATICRASRLPVVLYNRANCRIAAATLARLAAECPSLIGFKDGHGDTEELLNAVAELRERLAFINGMPTAEIHAGPFAAMGIPAYSSAVFNFVPRTAMQFFHANRANDVAVRDGLLRSFFLPFSRIRAAKAGYAVSIVKAGADLVGRSAGPVRPPLSQLTPSEREKLGQLIASLGPQD